MYEQNFAHVEVLWFSLLCKSVHRFFITKKLYILQNCKTRITFIFDYTEIVWNVFSRLFTQNLKMGIALVWNCYILHWIDLFLWISSFQLCLETEAGRAGVTLMKYRLQTKLLECNVFTGVCPFTGGRVPRFPTPLPLRHQTWAPTAPLATEIWWSSLGDLFRLVYLRTLPPVLTSSGGHWNMYGWQAGGTYPAGMLFCVFACIIYRYWMSECFSRTL